MLPAALGIGLFHLPIFIKVILLIFHLQSQQKIILKSLDEELESLRVKFVRFRFKDGITNGVEWYVVSGGKSISIFKKF